jgi:hypothetical protein
MDSMENFFNWLSKSIPMEEVQVWMNRHNMIPEKIELYGDFAKSLYLVIFKTYLGFENGPTRIRMSEDEINGHFNWAWKKVIEDFGKENINFKMEGEHKEYFESFFMDVFYHQEDEKVRNSIDKFIDELFLYKKSYTKSDLEILTDVYKSFEKNFL